MGRPRKHRHDLPQRVYHRHGAYFFVDKSGKWHRLGADFYEAMVQYAKINSAKSPVTITMAHAFDRYQRDVVPKKALTTQKTNVRELAKLRMAFGHMRPDDVRPRDVYAFMDARQAPIRANREKALLSHVFSYAIRWGMVEINPCRQVSNYKEEARKRYVTDEEFWAVHDLATPLLRAVMKLALITGLRGTDLRALRKSAITDEGVVVKQSKTGNPLLYHWNDDLRDAVNEALELQRGVQSVFLLPNRRGQPYTAHGMATMWTRLMNKYAESGGEKFQMRDLRAKSGSDHATGEHLGHQDRRTLERHYRRRPKEVSPHQL